MRVSKSVRAFVAVAVIALFAGIVPIWMYVDSARVPSGAEAEEAKVVSVDRIDKAGRDNHRSGGSRVATVRLPGGGEDTVLLRWHLDYPDAGDTITVYEQDGELRTTSERSILVLVGGVVVVLAGIAVAVAALTGRLRIPNPSVRPRTRPPGA